MFLSANLSFLPIRARIDTLAVVRLADGQLISAMCKRNAVVAAKGLVLWRGCDGLEHLIGTERVSRRFSWQRPEAEVEGMWSLGKDWQHHGEK